MSEQINEAEVERIAKGLTKAQRAVVLAGSSRTKKWSAITRHAKRSHQKIGRRLEFFVRVTAHGLCSFRLNARGLAVRALLQRSGR